MASLRDLNQQHGDSRTLGTHRVGFFPAELPDDGPDGPNPLLNDALDPTKEYGWQIVTWPATGALFAEEDGAFTFDPAADGVETFTYRLREDGVLLSTVATVELTSGEEAPPEYLLSPIGASIAVQVGSVSWAYTPPTPDAYILTPAGLQIQIEVGSVAWAYTPPAPPEAHFTPQGLFLDVEVGSVSWSYSPPTVIDTDEPYTLAQAKAHLNLIADEPHMDDELISGLITASREYAEQYANRIYTDREVEWIADGFYKALPFPVAPIGEVLSVSYYDTAGVLQTLESSSYRLRAHKDYPELVLTADAPKSQEVIVRFTGGHGPSNPVPKLVIAAMKLVLGHLYANRETVIVNGSAVDMPEGAKALLWPYRRLRI